MSILSNIQDLVWGRSPNLSSETRYRDPFGNPANSIYDVLNAMDGISMEGMDIPQVYTACMIYANALLSLDFMTYAREGDSNIEQPDHPVTRLMNEKVNELMKPADFKTLAEFHSGITGNFNAFIVRNRKGIPDELIPLDPHKFVGVEVIKNKKQWKWNDGEGKVRIIPDEDMFHISGPSMDGLVGMNPIEVHRNTFATTAHMSKYLERFFANGAHLKHVIETDKVLGEKAYNNFMSTFVSVFAGANNTGKTLILEDGMKLKPVQVNPADAAYIMIQGNITKTVANIYRIPLYLFNEYKEGAQYDNVESQDLSWIKYGIGPKVVQWEEEIKRKLYPPRSKYYGEFDLFSLSRGDMKSLSEYVNRFFILGTLNQDEIRRKYLSLNPLPDGQGKRYYVQGNNMVPIDKIDEIYEAKLQGGIPGEGGPKAVDTDMEGIKEK